MLRSQNGSAGILAIFVAVIAVVLSSGLFFMSSSQVRLTAKNENLVEAQSVAEAGAKRAIIGLQHNRTDWAWADSVTHNPFWDNTDEYYVVSVVKKDDSSKTSLSDGSTAAPGTTYLITSTGYCNNSSKTVVVNVTTSGSNTAGGPFAYGVFAAKSILIQNPLVNGDIFTNGPLQATSHALMVKGAAYGQSLSADWGLYTPPSNMDTTNFSKGFSTITKPLTLNVDIPALPSLTMTGTDIRTTWTNGQWSNSTYTLTNGEYYYNGDYQLNGHSYYIPAGQTVTLYVNGTFALDSNSNITCDGNLIVYAQGDIDFYGGNIGGSANSDIQIYANGVVNFSSNVTGQNVLVAAYNTNNKNNPYNNGIAFNGGSINKNMTNTVTKVYVQGGCALNDISVIGGAGSGLLTVTGNVGLNGGTAPNTLVIAGGDINANSNSVVAGIYTNGNITFTGTTVNYNSNLLSTLGLGSSSDFAVNSWTWQK